MKTGGGFTPKDEKSPPANAVDKEPKPVPCCAGNIGTGNDSGCSLAKLPFLSSNSWSVKEQQTVVVTRVH